ncbi:30S ribosomal protein S5 [Candidatus Pacearchaeota archaeon]|nr:30S ribosomal protein S5 [Candidatus Pacearchaeota archaeon]
MVKEEKTDSAEKKKEINNGAEEAAEAPRETGVKRRERPAAPTREEVISKWNPKTKIGKLVKSGEVRDIDYISEKYKILEPEIIDTLLDLKSDLLLVGQAKGKFGGGKRTWRKQTQKKTAEGNVPTFSIMAIVGDENGRVGIGKGRAKETVPAKEKAVRNAKLGLTKITRGCGSFDCSCGLPHSIPARVEGKCGSIRIILMPAPQGTGLVAGDELKKLLRLTGIKDIYSKTFGKTKTTMNLAKACLDALKKTSKIQMQE